MSVRLDDTYRVRCRSDLSSDRLVSFMMLYQPIIGGDGILVYLTLMAEARNQKESGHRRLFSLLQNISADTFERARKRLELNMLVRTYRRHYSDHDSYLYVLNLPLGPVDFMAAPSFHHMYVQAMGEKDAKLSERLLCQPSVSMLQYQEVTARNDEDERDISYQTEYTTVKPAYVFVGNEDDSINFDYSTFFMNATDLTFPPELHTEQILSQIGRNGTRYGISAQDMLHLVIKGINLSTNQFDPDLFDRVCAGYKTPKNRAIDDPYDLSPLSYLMSRQKGRPVAESDRRIIDYLAQQMQFPNDLTNVLIDYALKKCDNILNFNYVSKVAAAWVRKGIDTRQKALDYLNNDRKETRTKKPAAVKRNIQEVPMPAYWNTRNDYSRETMSDEKLKELQRLQKEMEK